MKIRLQEIEFGNQNPEKSKEFYNAILGHETVFDQERIKEFKSGTEGVDFITTRHLPIKVVVTSFLTDNMQLIIDRLRDNGIPYDRPHNSHLRMITIEFKDPDGYLIRVNQLSDTLPSWLTA